MRGPEPDAASDRITRIRFPNFPGLAAFDPPEWSHLSAPDSVTFTRRLVPPLKKALGATPLP